MSDRFFISELKLTSMLKKKLGMYVEVPWSKPVLATTENPFKDYESKKVADAQIKKWGVCFIWGVSGNVIDDPVKNARMYDNYVKKVKKNLK